MRGAVWCCTMLYGAVHNMTVVLGNDQPVVLYGAVWWFVVRSGALWCRVVLYGTVWWFVVRYGAVWCRLVLYGAVWWFVVLSPLHGDV